MARTRSFSSLFDNNPDGGPFGAVLLVVSIFAWVFGGKEAAGYDFAPDGVDADNPPELWLNSPEGAAASGLAAPAENAPEQH